MFNAVRTGPEIGNELGEPVGTAVSSSQVVEACVTRYGPSSRVPRFAFASRRFMPSAIVCPSMLFRNLPFCSGKVTPEGVEEYEHKPLLMLKVKAAAGSVLLGPPAGMY